MIPVEILGVHPSPESNASIVLLGDPQEATRVLPIVVEAGEADSISSGLAGVVTSLPAIHDLMIDLLRSIGAELAMVEVTEFRDGTLLAQLVLENEGREERLSAQLSDAIALAVRLGAPLAVEDGILRDAAVEVEHGADEQFTDEEVTAMVDAFQGVLATTSPSDFGGPIEPEFADQNRKCPERRRPTVVAKTNQTPRDHLLTEVDLVKERLDRFFARAAEVPSDARAALEQRGDRVGARAEALAARIREWVELQVGTSSAVEDLGEAVDTLEADLDAVEGVESGTYGSLVDRQIRLWTRRLQHLRVKEALGVMELQDELTQLESRLAAARTEVLIELRRTAADAREVVVDLREDVEEVLVDVRNAVERAADVLVDHHR